MTSWTPVNRELRSDSTTPTGEIQFDSNPPLKVGTKAMIRAKKGQPLVLCSVRLVNGTDGIVTVSPNDFDRLGGQGLSFFETRPQTRLDRIHNVLSIKGVVILAVAVLVVGPIVTTAFWRAPDPVGIPQNLVVSLQRPQSMTNSERASFVSEVQQFNVAIHDQGRQLHEHNVADLIVLFVMIFFALLVAAVGLVPLYRDGGSAV
jgi:hypothetical protein